MPSPTSTWQTPDPSMQAWLEGCIDIDIDASSSSFPFIVGEDAQHLAPLVSSSNDNFATPTRRKRRPGAELDDEATPRAPIAGFASAPSFSSYSDSSSRSSARSSGRASPSKKEASLRRTADFPVRRVLLAAPGTPIDRLPPSVLALMRDLKAFGKGSRAVIPGIFYDRMCKENNELNQPERAWFLDDSPVSEDQIPMAEYRDRRLRCIWAKSLTCTRRSEHEAGWNDSVHGPLLDEAVDGVVGVQRRNITSKRITAPYRDPDPELGETKIDYGLFLEPLPDSNLARLQRSEPVLHVDVPDAPQTPLAVSIETKSTNARPGEGATQLANWARAQFRHLEGVVRVQALRLGARAGGLGSLSLLPATVGGGGGGGGGGPGGTAEGTRTGEEKQQQTQLPVLPLVFVLGNRWSVFFAQRCEGETLIWQDVPLGDTNTLEGCYFVLQGLRRLMAWADVDMRNWWEDVAAVHLVGAGVATGGG